MQSVNNLAANVKINGYCVYAVKIEAAASQKAAALHRKAGEARKQLA